MTGLYLEGKLLEDTGIAQSEKCWLENPLWSPFLVQMETIQFTGQSRFGVKMEEGKKRIHIFFEILCLDPFSQCQAKISPTFLEISLSLFFIYNFKILLGAWIEALHVQLLKEKSEIASPLLSNIYKS